MSIADFLFIGLIISLLFLMLFLGFGFFSNSYKLMDFMDTLSLGWTFLTKSGAFVWADVNTILPWDDKANNTPIKEAEPFIFCSEDGSIMTMMTIDGMLTIDGTEELESRIVGLTKRLGQFASTKGHIMQFGMYYDPYNGGKVIDEVMQPTMEAARKIGLGGLDFFFEDNKKSLERFIADQKYYVALWTTPEIISKESKKLASEENTKERLNSINLKRTQGLTSGMEYIKAAHISFVSAFKSALASNKDSAVRVRVMPCEEAVRLWRSMTDPLGTAPDWKVRDFTKKPALQGDGSDPLADAWWPDIRREIFPDRLEKEGDFIKATNRLYAFIHVNLWPNAPETFANFIRGIEASRIPVAMSFNISGGGFSNQGFADTIKGIVAAIASFHSDNKLYSQSLDILRKHLEAGNYVVGAQMVLATWIDTTKEDAKILATRQATLRSIVQSWGDMSATADIADPGMAFSSVLTGICKKLSAPMTLAPFHEIVPMLPIDQPARLWRNGSFLFRSGTRLMPMEQGSRIQSAALDIGVAPMGGGKSLLLNMYDMAFILQSNGVIPFLTKLDIGYSGKSLITALQAALPEDKKHLVLYSRLRMTPEYAVNIMDLPLGFRRPTPYHKSFIVSFVSLLIGDKTTGAVKDVMPGLISKCVDRAYIDMFEKPKEFKMDKDPELTAALKKIPEFDPKKRYHWLDIRDMFFSNHRGRDNYLALAIKAQSYAVPTVPELISISRDRLIASEYDSVSGGTVIDEFSLRISDAMNEIPIINGSSVFNTGAARVIVLDLEEAAPSSDPWRVAVMYTLAKFIGTFNFFRRPEDANADSVDPLYMEYQTKLLESIRETPKRLSMDEVHRIFKNSAVSKNIEVDIETFGREGRKNSVHIGLYSQKLIDIPNNIIDLTQSRYILGTGTKDEKEIIKAKFGLNDTAIAAMGDIGTPSAAGANLLAIFRTSFQDPVVQFLTNTVGRKTLWLLSTHPKEAPLRDKLYAKMGVRETIEFLTKRFQSSEDIDVLLKEIARKSSDVEDDDDGAISVLADMLFQEYLEDRMGSISKARFKNPEDLSEYMKFLVKSKKIKGIDEDDVEAIAKEVWTEITDDKRIRTRK